MNDFDEYERQILDAFRDKNVRAGRGLLVSTLFHVTPAARRGAAIESLVTKGILEQANGRLILTEQGESAIF